MQDRASDSPTPASPSPVGARWTTTAWVLTGLSVLLAVVVYWPAMEVRYFADDYLQIAKVEGLLGPHPPTGLYSFFVDDPEQVALHRARGSLPWWTVDHFRFVHVRPLASLLLELDHAIAPRGAWLHHLHSMGWLVAMLAAAAVLLRRSTTPVIATVALAIFCVDESLAWTVAWLANRCAMITATFVFVAMILHMRREHSREPRLWWLELVAWTLAFAAGEYAVCGLAYLAAYAMFGRRDPVRIRAAAVVPALIALGLFAIGYAASSAGVSGGTSYIDPFAETSRYANEFVERTSRAAGEAWLSIPGETEQLWNRYYDTPLPKLLVLWNQSRTTLSIEQAHGRFSFGAVALVIVGTWLLARRHLTAHERRTVAWTAVGSVLSLVPLAATPPVTRTLALAAVGPAVFVASVTVAAVRAWRRPAPDAKGRAWLRLPLAALLSTLCLGLLVQHTVNDARWARKHIERLTGLGTAFEQFFVSRETKKIDLEGKHVVVLAGPELVTSFYGQWIVNAVGVTPPQSWHTLAMGARRYIVRRHGADKLEMSALGETVHVSLQETLFRKPAERLIKGESVDVGLFEATVVQELAWQGPSAILYEFDRPLTDPSLVFLVTGDAGLEPFTLPAAGRSVALPVPSVPHDESLDTPG